jgi:hypothetical protein
MLTVCGSSSCSSACSSCFARSPSRSPYLETIPDRMEDKEDQVAAKSKSVRLDANISDIAVGSRLMKHDERLDCEAARGRQRHWNGVNTRLVAQDTSRIQILECDECR